MSESILACIAAAQACVMACERCASACLDEDHVQTMTECIRLDQDCADACRVVVAYLSRGSHFAAEIGSVCAKVCDACATECMKHKAEHCRICAEACRRCAEACRRIVA